MGVGGMEANPLDFACVHLPDLVPSTEIAAQNQTVHEGSERLPLNLPAPKNNT